MAADPVTKVPTRPYFRLVALLVGLALLTGLAQAQRIGATKGFKVAQTEDGKIKSLLEAASAVPIEGGKQFLLSNMTLNLGATNNPELRISAPECLYDTASQQASSAGALKVQTPDGKFLIEGQGFLWRQTNSSLFISNQVHTVVQPEMLEGTAGKSRQDAPGTPGTPIEIFSRRFDYLADSGLGHYREEMRLSGTNLALTGGSLTIRVPLHEPIQSVAAEENVVADYGEIHATGQSTIYSTATGIVEMSGHPAWRADLREGRGDELTIDRTNRIFRAKGNAWLKMPSQGLGAAGLLSRDDPNSATAEPASDEFIEVLCSSYELHTNWGIFRPPVQVTQHRADQVTGTLNCRTMTLTFAGTNQLQTLLAEDQVVIQESTNRFTGEKALYTSTNGILELTGQPAWESGRRQGRGDLLRFEVQRDAMLVRSNASMRVPAEELSQTPMGVPASAGKATETSRIAPDQYARIFSAEYTLEKDAAVFLGGVHIVHPQMDLVCRRLQAQLAPGDNQNRRIIAEQAVIFDLKDERDQTVHGTGDRADYVFGRTGAVTNDLLHLTGRPALLVTTNGVVESQRITLDRASNKLSTQKGDWHIRGKAPAARTNLFILPTRKK